MKPESAPSNGWETTSVRSQWLNQHDAGRLISFSLPCPEVDFAAILAAAAGSSRFLWRDPDGVTLAGFGTATNLIAYGPERVSQIQAQAQQLFASARLLADTPALAAPRLFGGFAFRPDFVPDNIWTAFGPAHFVLPHYQYLEQGAERWLTINAFIAPDDDPAAIPPQLREALSARIEQLAGLDGAATVAAAAVAEVNYPLTMAAWEEIIATTTDRMRTTELEKVVLSRVCELRFHDDIPIPAVLAHLDARYPDCYRFLFEPRPYHAFLGATPELLVRVDGAALRTMGLAGSIGRGADEATDAALGQALLDSAKDRFEHDVVVQMLRQRLTPVTTELSVPDTPILLKLGNIQHLYTPVSGRLKEPAGVLPLVDLLHPTPALGGVPRELAMELIAATEPVPRGWYAAPIGWLDYRGDGQFGVAIRSAVCQRRRAWLYAGGGIVAQSEADKEWAEAALKFRPMLAALGAQEVVNG
ncbi:MAG: isochorismate synthase [Anaerolineales bacterium]|nr:isochorismate synthase [Anaerolineales bacterium]